MRKSRSTRTKRISSEATSKDHKRYIYPRLRNSVFFYGIILIAVGAGSRDIELLIQGGTFSAGAALILGTLTWNLLALGSTLTRIQSLTTGIGGVIVASISAEVGMLVAGVNLPLVATMCVIAIPIARAIGTILHRKFLGERILRNLEAEAGRTREEDRKLSKLAENSSLPAALTYAATVAIALATFLTTEEFDKSTIRAVASTGPTILCMIIYNLSVDQRKIREHIRENRASNGKRPY